MSAPAILIRIEFEAPTRVDAVWLHESDEIRMRDWLSAHPDEAELVARAMELQERERAA